MGNPYQILSEKDRKCDMFMISYRCFGERDIFIEEDDYHKYWSEAMWLMDCTGNYIADYVASERNFCMIISLYCSAHAADNTVELYRMIKHVNNVYTRWHNKKYGRRGTLTRFEGIKALRSQRDLLEAMRNMYSRLTDCGRNPNTWRFCGRYERKKGYNHGMIPEPYSFPGYLRGQFNGMKERTLYRAITTQDESYWQKVRDSMSAKERYEEYRERISLPVDIQEGTDDFDEALWAAQLAYY